MINRILIVGNGSIGMRHLRIAREQFPNAQIYVLGHREVSEIPEFSNGYLTTITAAIQFAPQIAVIANPSTFHIPISQALARNGTHLLIEKPISFTAGGGTMTTKVGGNGQRGRRSWRLPTKKCGGPAGRRSSGVGSRSERWRI